MQALNEAVTAKRTLSGLTSLQPDLAQHLHVVVPGVVEVLAEVVLRVEVLVHDARNARYVILGRCPVEPADGPELKGKKLMRLCERMDALTKGHAGLRL